MKHWISKPTIKRVVAKTTCDICNASIERESDEIYDLDFNCSIGQYCGYDGGAYGTYIDVDLCKECLMDKVIPFIESFGNKVSSEEIDC